MDNKDKKVKVHGNHILVGLGGTGGKILRAFKMRMFEEFPTAEERKKLPVSLLYVDSTDEMMPKDGKPRPDFRVMGQDASFTNNEFLNIKAVDVEHILSHINNYPSVKGIVDNVQAVKSAIGSLGKAAGQKRRAGRLLFAANAVGYVNSLNDAYARAEQVSHDASDTNIYIFAGLSGGTGSGSIVDAMVQARKEFPNAKISVFAMIPEIKLPKADMDQGRYYQNGYAAMAELNALQAGRWDPQDVTGSGTIHIYNDVIKGIADGLTVYSNVNENGMTISSLDELPKVVSDYIFARVFYINDQDSVNSDIVRSFNFENMDDFALEFDETGIPNANGQVPVARTKKINSFGIKRVIYPELRVLKHITYTVGLSVLYQFKYNNWKENLGYFNEERNKDYRREYFNEANLAEWMIDEAHLTLEKKILESDEDYPAFADFWHDRAIGYAPEARKSDDPLNSLDNRLADFFADFFRDDTGAEGFFRAKERVIPEMVKEIKRKIEHGLFEKWKMGDISIVELQKVSKLLIEKMGEIRTDLETAIKEEEANQAAIEQERADTVDQWSHLGILQRMAGVGNRLFADHQTTLADLYTSKTRLVALQFAKRLAAALMIEINRMDTDISEFASKITKAIEETEKLVTAQAKKNKGLEDMRGAIIEVCEEEQMEGFENNVRVDKIDMPNIARQIREAILPVGDFTNFSNLTARISVDDIKDAFDVKLAEIVKVQHQEKADAHRKVLGLNILTQLMQKLDSDDAIKEFATTIVKQSGVYLALNNDQMQLHLRNNEGNLSPTNPASINKKAILVSIPSPEDNEQLVRFADKLEEAFKNSFNQTTARTTITVNRKSPRKDELSIVTVSYCYPMRAIDWMRDYKARYERFLHTGNPATDASNAILLHSEGNGSQLPPIFAVENAEEIAQQKMAEQQAQQQAQANPFGAQQQAQANPFGAQQQGFGAPQQQANPFGAQQQGFGAPQQQPAGMPGGMPAGMPQMGGMPPQMPQMQKPQIQLYINVNNQPYGPCSYEKCEQLVANGQLTAQSFVWKEGMPAWAPAGQVPELQMLFMPKMPGGMPPMGGGAPMPPMPGMPGM